MIICDMHNDSLMKVSSESGLINDYNMSAKRPQLQFFCEFCPKMNETADIRRRRLMNMFNIYLSECQRLDITAVYDCKTLGELSEYGGAYSLLSIEGGGGLFADSPELDILYRGGLRVLGMAWDSNELCAASGDENDTGLTAEGIKLARKATDMGIILDVSHMSDKSFYQLHEEISYPMIATHSNFRALVNHKRNLTDDMAKIIAKRGGVIGINLYPPLLSENASAASDDIIKQIDYALELVGEDTLAYGFDIDGTSGLYPKGLDEASSIHDKVTDMLLSRYSGEVVEKIAGGNVIRFLCENLG